MPKYKVITGLDYAGKRAEPGDVVDDIPGKSVPWLIEQGHIEKIESNREPKSPSEGDE